jgi:hypothetical protein
MFEIALQGEVSPPVAREPYAGREKCSVTIDFFRPALFDIWVYVSHRLTPCCRGQESAVEPVCRRRTSVGIGASAIERVVRNSRRI